MEALINGVHLRYEVHGEGEPVLLVHGFPLSRELWRPLIEPLREQYRLILPDLRGHGESEASAEMSMARYAEDLAALLDHLGERRPVVLVGLSMGGYIGFEFCRRHPERVRALVLANTRAQADSEEAARGRRETAEKALREGSGVVAEGMMGKLFAPDASGELRERWRGIMAATPAEGVAAALRAMAERPDSFDTLRRLDRPVLVVAGEEDAVIPVEDARRMQEAVRDARLEIISGAGHLTPVEQPERFVAALRGFLDTLGSSASGS